MGRREGRMDGGEKERRGNGDGERKEKTRNKKKEGTKAYLNAVNLIKTGLLNGKVRTS